MRSPDEIKKALKLCQKGSCKFCPYDEDGYCGHSKNEDALSYIQQLESRLAQAERERDAAVHDLKLVGCCGSCVNNEGGCTTECDIVRGTLTGWQWRGVCEENTKDGKDGQE